MRIVTGISRLAIAVSLAAAFPGLASAQIGVSTITGRVVDPSGAAVPNVNVTVIQTSQNYRYTTTTNNEGLYRVTSLPPGDYRITYELRASSG